MDRRSFLTTAAAIVIAPRIPVAAPIHVPTEAEWAAVQAFCTGGCVAGDLLVDYLKWCVSLDGLDPVVRAEAARHLSIIGPICKQIEEKHERIYQRHKARRGAA